MCVGGGRLHVPMADDSEPNGFSSRLGLTEGTSGAGGGFHLTAVDSSSVILSQCQFTG